MKAAITAREKAGKHVRISNKGRNRNNICVELPNKHHILLDHDAIGRHFSFIGKLITSK